MTSEHAPAPKSADAIVGEQVHHWMWRARVSQTELAKHLGISQTNVSRRLRGETGWTVDDLLICARVLSVPPGDLLPGADYVPSSRHPEAGSTEYAMRDLNPQHR
jgi:transcriptional regulator with XRE-family HTH domain